MKSFLPSILMLCALAVVSMPLTVAEAQTGESPETAPEIVASTLSLADLGIPQAPLFEALGLTPLLRFCQGGPCGFGAGGTPTFCLDRYSDGGLCLQLQEGGQPCYAYCQ